MQTVATLDFARLHDADQLDKLLVDWQIDSMQLESGMHDLINERVIFVDLIVERSRANLAKKDEYRIPPNTTLFALFQAGCAPGRWCGFEIPNNVLLVNQSGRDHFAVMPPDHEAITILMDNRLVAGLDLLPHALVDQRKASPRSIIPLAEPAAAKYREWLFAHFASRHTLRSIAGSQAESTEYRQRLLDGLRQLLDHGIAMRDDRPRPARRFPVVRQACQIVSGRIQQHVRAPQLVAELGVNLRKLERAFANMLGMSPQQYIRMSKLHAVRRELRCTPRDATTVSQVALKYGFTELGRFSVRYRQVFGESPSETFRAG